MFENETKLDLETNMKASKHMTHNTKIISCVMSAGIMILGIALLLLELFVFKENDYFLPIFFIAFGAIMLILMLCLTPITRSLSKKAMQGKESTVKYVFREEGYEAVTLMNDGTSSTTQGNYAAFTKAREYADMWLLYLNRAAVFVVMKDGMTKGAAEELSEFLYVRIGKKYKVCDKKK